MKNQYREPVMYFIVGVIVTLVDWVTYSVLVKYAGFGVTPSNIVSWVVAVFVAYILNKKLVFLSDTEGTKDVIREFFSFVIGRLFSGGVVIILVPILMFFGVTQTLFGVEGFIAKGVASVIGMILNYFFSKFLVFKSK